MSLVSVLAAGLLYKQQHCYHVLLVLHFERVSCILKENKRSLLSNVGVCLLAAHCQRRIRVWGPKWTKVPRYSLELSAYALERGRRSDAPHTYCFL